MAKILKEKEFNDVLPGQKLCRQCVTEYEKLTKPPENENMTKISWVNIHGVAQHSQASNAKGKLKKVLNVYKENISATSYVLDLEIEEPSLIYDRDTKNKAEELDRLYAAMKEKLVTTSNTEKLQVFNLVPDSWSQKYCSEYFGVSEYLIRSARELKQRKGILA